MHNVTRPPETIFPKEPAVTDDHYAWLEEIGGADPLEWVRAQNAATESTIASSPLFVPIKAEMRAILDSDARIPAVQKIGGHYYNFWKDATHERGIWRRTTLDAYRRPQPCWETVLDLDALNEAEGESWVWHGAETLKPQNRRCLIALSRGGSDADVTREFDLLDKDWVRDGFCRPEAKGGLGWIDQDTVYVYTDFGDGSLTDSGYPRIVKQWRRGTPMSTASVVYAGRPEDLYVLAYRDPTPGYERDFVSRSLAFYSQELYLRGTSGTLTKIDAPDSAGKSVWRRWLMLELREPWEIGGAAFPAGALLAMPLDAWLAGRRDAEVLFEPSDSASLAGVTYTRHHLVLNILDDVRSRLTVLTRSDSGWMSSQLAGAPGLGSVIVEAVEPDVSDAVWLTTTDYLTPTTLSLVEIGREPQPLKVAPSVFDASGHVLEQHFATSKDGTRVPYFLVRPRNLARDGRAPTLLYGYGGFEVSLTPGYLGGVGKAWLERGGVYVVANIRGGGEYGPRWHQAALKADRARSYEDFEAVARDLIAGNITAPAHLGIQGGSNGGLLVGNMLVRCPELFGAVVCQVPLLDMKRYSHLLAGASWMTEYGNPDAEDWDFMQSFSPYHLFDPAKACPPTLFMTSTRDDRVHPGHARKMAAKMIDAGKDVLYYENTEGGHGGAANNAQAAHMHALIYTFLWQRLGQD